MLNNSKIISLLFALLIISCAPVTNKVDGGGDGKKAFHARDISDGLPVEGLWRNDISLHDVNGDGFLDILLPPIRLAKTENRPSIFLRNSQKNTWSKAGARFPSLDGYDYGGIAVADLNGDNLYDMALASHQNGIIVLHNQGEDSFMDAGFPNPKGFSSRCIHVSDLNNDGKPDIVTMSEVPLKAIKELEKKKDQPGAALPEVPGLMVAINKGKGRWEANLVPEGKNIYGDSVSSGDFNGDGLKDILIAHMTAISQYRKIIFIAGKSGGYSPYPSDFMGNNIVTAVRVLDLEKDGRDEMVFKVSELGKGAHVKIRVFALSANGIEDRSAGLDGLTKVQVFDTFDMDGDGIKEIMALCMDGLHVYKWSGSIWEKIAFNAVSEDMMKGAFDLKLGRNADGSILAVYNLGSESGMKNGVKAYLWTR